MMGKASHLFVRGTAATLLMGISQAALAQSATQPASAPAASSGGLSEIIVTATRRETNVQDTPLAVTAIGGDALRNSGISDPRQLSSLAPSLTVDQGLSNGQTHVSIRGIASTDFGIGSNSPVAINIDDVYQPFQFGIATQVFDMNRIEVLRGPQGTLFGKNTTSGALNYYSQTPVQREEGYFTLDGGGGDFGHYSVEAVYNKPLSETLATRISLRADRRDDYVDNLFDGSKLGHYNNYSGRIQFAWTPSDATTVNLKIFGVKNKGDGPIYISKYLENPCTSFTGFFNFPRSYLCTDGVTPAPDSPGSRKTYSDVPIQENYDSYGATLKIDHEIGEYTFTSITGWQHGSNYIATNDDGTGGDAFHSLQASKTEQISQELRLATPAEKALRAVFGVFGQYDKITTDQGSVSSEADIPAAYGFNFDNYGGSFATQKGRSLAAFTSVTYEFTPAFSLVGGARYSYEKKKRNMGYIGANSLFAPGFLQGLDLQTDDISYKTILSRYGLLPEFETLGNTTLPGFNHPTVDSNGFVRDEDSWKRLTWDVTGNFKPTEDSLIFARVASGFRSGGYSIGITNAEAYYTDNAGTQTSLNPEKVMSYELGFKSEWFDRTLRVNGSVFWTDYKDMQVQVVNSSGVGSRLINAAKARIKGAELEIELAPAKGLHISGSVGYNDAKYRDFVSPVDPNRPNNGDATGNQLPYAPEWTANLGGSYEVPAGDAHSVVFATNWSYRSRIYFNSFEEQIASDPGRVLGDVRISYGTSERGWRISAYAKNVTNQDVRAFVFPFGGRGQPDTYVIAPTIYAPKRTWGLQASFDF